MRRAAPYLVALIVLAPALRDPVNDSYPLSTYPMFADERPDVANLPTVVGVDSEGSVHRLSPQLISGSDEVILAAATVADAIDSGDADVLCAEVADRVAAATYVELIVRTEVVDVVAHIADGTDPLSINEHARCGAAE